MSNEKNKNEKNSEKLQNVQAMTRPEVEHVSGGVEEHQKTQVIKFQKLQVDE